MFKKKPVKSYSFNRRAFLLGLGKGALSTALLSRMYYLQIMEAKHYHTLSEENRIKLKLTAPERARLLDRFGKPLAVNTQNFQLVINGEEAKPERKTIAKLQELFEIEDEEIEAYFAQRHRVPRFYPIALKEQLTWEEVAKFEIHVRNYPGVTVEEGLVREYPEKEAICHYLGYVQPIAETDDIDKKYLKLPKFRIGRSGVEKMLDEDLRGKPGLREVEITAGLREIREVSNTPPLNEPDKKLALDLDLQKFTYERLSKERSASCVVMDIRDGGILACASYPAYDPNMFVDGISKDYWKELQQNEYGILLNKCMSGLYAPGSTFKLMVALAGLEAGTINPDEVIYCSGGTRLGAHYFRCWKPGGHGPRVLDTAITGSCNVYFYEMARRVGIDRLAAMAHRMGYGSVSDLNFPNEKAGVVPSTEWKREHYNRPWTAGETFNSGIGQGYVLVTPFQQAIVAARIAAGGKKVIPSLLKSDEPIEFESLGLNPDHVRRVQMGMIHVVNEPGGTAHHVCIKEPGMEMAGKTGTSQVVGGDKGKGTGIWKYQHHGLFIGFAPIQDPKYVVSAVVEHGGGGARAAAPLGRDVMLKLETLRKEQDGTDKPPLTQE